MTTLAQLKYDLLNIIRGGIQSDEDPISLRQIEFWIINTRAELIRQQINKGNFVADNVSQVINCAEVELVDLSQCCGIKTECFAYRTKLPIPTPIEVSYADMITKVGPIDFLFADSFHFIPVSRVKYELDNKFTPNAARSFLYSGYIYVAGNNLFGLKNISIEGVFENPLELAKFVDCAGTPCFSDQDSFPISNWMIEQMKIMIRDRDLSLILNLPQDTENDSRVTRTSLPKGDKTNGN